MSNIAVRVEGLGKHYHIGGAAERHDSLRAAITHAATSPLRNLQRLRGSGHARDGASEAAVWALRDLSFEVQHGEVLGIVGHNGAGKSTLLKILSRITEPTTGYAHVRGRIGSLLEVGTGFHPELTGRENIFLNGSILGMDRRSILAKMDEIIDFSGVERYLDTPVKRYSSGMYLRLAFAVAAHLEPDVLIMDEVLAVGDAEFQRKCLGKMGQVAKSGRTVLFVSHNMPAVVSLCQRSIVLSKGRIIVDDCTDVAIQQYIHGLQETASTSLAERSDRRGNGALRFTGFSIRDSTGDVVPCAYSGQAVDLCFEYESSQAVPLRNVHVSVGIHGKFDDHLFHLATDTSGFNFDVLPARGSVRCSVPRLPLQPGRYPFNLLCAVGGDVADWIRHAGVLEVQSGDFFTTGRLPPGEQGPFLTEHQWHISEFEQLPSLCT